MGLMKSKLGRKAARVAKPSERECLWIEWEGRREIVPIVTWAYQAEWLGTLEVEGKKYHLVLSRQRGELAAIPYKEAKPVALPTLRSPLRAKFTEYFNHPFDAIVDQSGEGWKTLKHRLDDKQIWNSWRDGDRLIGLGFGKTTRYALIDIDTGSPYYSEEGLRDIQWALEDIGINSTILIQSSYSQGWHLYFAFSRPIPTFGLSCLLHQTMEVAGLAVAKGVLEIFPNRKGWQKDAVTQYNRHRLPLQPAAGSALLNADLQPYSQDLATFLDRLDETAIANDINLIEELATEAKQNYNPSKRKGAATGAQSFRNPNARKWKKNLEGDIATGWTGYGQSNQFLRKIAEHGRIFLGYDDEYQLGVYIAQTAIAAPGFITYCRHQREIHGWALRWARWAMKKRWPYGTRRGGEFKQLGKGGLTNEEKRAECLERVADAITDYEESGRKWPTTIRGRRKLIAGMANCSESTLNKPVYLALWHPEHLESGTQDRERTAENAVDNKAPKQDTARDTALSTNAVSHPDKYCVNAFSQSHYFQSSQSLGKTHTVLPPAPADKVNYPKPIQEESYSQSKKKMSSKTVPIPGDWLIEPDRPHILLRLESVDEDGEWCRCQDARERQKGYRGSLYFLPELIPAPMAIADESTTTPLPEE